MSFKGFQASLRAVTIAAGAALAIAPVSASAAALVLERISTSNEIATPIHAASPDGDGERLFIVSQTAGEVYIYDRTSGAVQPTPFLTIAGVGTANVEEGAQSIAFAPDFQTSGLFYVSFINTDGDHQVVEYAVSASNPNLADPLSARTIITVDHPVDGEGAHFGGWVDFGPDNYLYVSTGDSNGDPINDNAQQTDNQLGSILRIDPSLDAFPADPNNNYAAPADNPFVGVDGDDAVWAYGLRNPFRPAFDDDTGVLYIADVGEDISEEINIGAAGANYGWPGYEGTDEFDLALLTGAIDNLVDPIYEYAHGTGPFEGFSVTGGGVYHGPIAELEGLYFFGDFVNGTIWSFRYDTVAKTVSELMSWTLMMDAGILNNVASFGFDGDGNMYVMDLFGGDVFLVANAMSDVPLPAAGLLMLAGLGGLLRISTKRKSSNRRNAD